jgi:hypothetical protein
MKAYGKVDVQTHVFLTSALNGDNLSALRPRLLYPRERAPQYIFDTRLGGPQNRSRQYEEVKILDPTGTRIPTSSSH